MCFTITQDIVCAGNGSDRKTGSPASGDIDCMITHPLKVMALDGEGHRDESRLGHSASAYCLVFAGSGIRKFPRIGAGGRTDSQLFLDKHSFPWFYSYNRADFAKPDYF